MAKIFGFFSTPLGFSLLLIFSFFLTMYIIGYTKSQRNEIVILNGKKDYYVLATILVAIILIAIYSKEKSNTPIYYIGLIIILILSIYTSYLSYTANLGYPNRIFISICAKVFIVSIIMVIFMIRFFELLIADDEKNKDKRYKDGTKGNLILKAHNRNRRLSNILIYSHIKQTSIIYTQNSADLKTIPFSLGEIISILIFSYCSLYALFELFIRN